ncbi:hypothetical protein HDU91_001981 [Kappamyces sp. JEL0680]|nr:hypothetical protein HDU91_001981 [Kappamyces sp. JEL0680]
MQSQTLASGGGFLSAPDSRTAFLLASRGIDSDRVMQNLVDINLGLSFEPLQGIADTDIEAYLRNEHETLVSLAIEDTKSRAISDFEGGLANHPRLRAYVGVVKDMNAARLSLERFNAATAFYRASEKTATNNDQAALTRCWGLFARMLDIHKENTGKLEPGHFRQVYKQSSRGEINETTIRFRTKMVDGARIWLEESYSEWLNNAVREHRSEVGGLPTVHKLVDAYLKNRFYANGRCVVSWMDQGIGKTPFWAHLFTLVRMGLRKDALLYVQKYAAELSSSKDANFPSYFKAWSQASDGHLPKAMRDSLVGEWNARIRDYFVNKNATPKGDLFKYVLYKIIGRCEVSAKGFGKNSDVIASTEDFMWLQTLLISETPGAEASYERYTLKDFSNSMLKLGKSYFPKTDIWFMVLLLGGEFERAVSELSLEPVFAADALHFAIAMAYYGVLSVPDSPKAIPLSNSLLSVVAEKRGNAESAAYQFHFVRIITQFVKEWLRTDPVDVFHYLYLIGLFGNPIDSVAPHSATAKDWDNGKEYTRHIHTIIRDILTESGNISQLLGQMRQDGRGRTAGTIEKYRSLIHLSSEQEFLDRIVLSAAEQCDREARFKDALELYNLAGQPNKVVELLIRQVSESLLSHSIAHSAGSKPAGGKESLFEGQDPVEVAARVLDYYMSRPQESASLEPRVIYTCRTLVMIAQIGELASQGHVEAALTKFYSLDVVPSLNDMTVIQKKAEAFNGLDESICRVMPSTLVQMTNCLSLLYKQVAQGRSAEREGRLRDIKAKTKAILSFCGLIQYQIPQEPLELTLASALATGSPDKDNNLYFEIQQDVVDVSAFQQVPFEDLYSKELAATISRWTSLPTEQAARESILEAPTALVEVAEPGSSGNGGADATQIENQEDSSFDMEIETEIDGGDEHDVDADSDQDYSSQLESIPSSHERRPRKAAAKAKHIDSPQFVPKRPMNPYLLFRQSRGEAIKKQYGNINFNDASKILSNEWRNLSAAEKKPFQLQHEKELADYKTKYGSLKFKKHQKGELVPRTIAVRKIISFDDRTGSLSLRASLANAGIEVTDNVEGAAALVAKCISTTEKFLTAILKDIPIVSLQWATAQGNSHHLLDPTDYPLKDPKNEALINFRLSESVKRAQKSKVFKGYTAYCTDRSPLAPTAILRLFEGAGGIFKGVLDVNHTIQPGPKILCFAGPDDVEFVSSLESSLYSIDLLLYGILKQELELDLYRMGIIRLDEDEPIPDVPHDPTAHPAEHALLRSSIAPHVEPLAVDK